ncbi:MFS transporter [Qaidamihabitans albus]|uniref:MFS transporter n=1 Tax=Qaidamihabitans albus TaxID=2795733 RepID=UPI0018F21ED0|nr:MFS transporter [Qaidamihabitans albus]
MRSVLGEAGFRRLWLAALFSETAEWILQVALPLYVYLRTGSAASTAATMVLGLLPAVALSPVAGLLADRCDRRLVLFLVCGGQALAALPLLLVHATDLLVVVYAVMAAQAALASVFEPARNALVPQLVGVGNVTAANGLLGLNGNLARLAGAALGGVLLGFAGLPGVLAAYLLALALAAALLARPFAVRADVRAGRQALFRAWADGIAEFGRNRRLRAAGPVLALTSIAQGMFLVLFVLFVTDSLGGGEPEVGLLRGIQAIGGLVAGAALATIARCAGPPALLGWGILALGIGSALIWNSAQVTTALGVYAALFAAVGVPSVVAGAGLQSMLQTVSEPQLSGRVLSTAFAGMAVFTAVGMLLAGTLVGALGLPVLLNVQAGLHVAAGVLVLQARPVPAAPGR